MPPSDEDQIWIESNNYSVSNLYEKIAISMYKESFSQTKSITQPPLKVLWATFPLCFNFLSGQPFGPDSQKTSFLGEKCNFLKSKLLAVFNHRAFFKL